MELPSSPKVYTLESAIERRKALKASGKQLVLTNGCFDLLHPGHVYYLQKAAQLGDVLWVALNTARSVAALKGPTRPILGDWERSYVLGGLECVSGILFFDTPRLSAEIQALEPDIYVKASDYTLDTLNPEERAALESVQARIHFLPFLSGYSTTGMLEKVRSALAAQSL